MAEAQDSETSQAIASEDPTSELSLLDTACYTAPSDELAGKSDCVSSPPIQVERNNDTPDALLERVASLTLAADVASPATMNEAFDCAADLAANAAATRRTSVEMRKAFTELLTANSEMLHGKKRRDV